MEIFIKCVAPEEHKVGNIEDVKTKSRAVGAKQTVRTRICRRRSRNDSEFCH